jgi:hypothetical protein
MTLVSGMARNMSIVAILTLFMAALVVMNIFRHSKVLLGGLASKSD